MKKIKLIYNPAAGNKSFPGFLDTFIKKFQHNGYIIDIFRTTPARGPGAGLRTLKDNREIYEAIIVAGGDGSINAVINVMMKENIRLPLGIIPAGTVNDFASHLNLPADLERCCDIILAKNLQPVDIGQVNNTYFINVCVGGVLSGVAHSTDTEIKNKLGKVAYYINGLKEITRIEPLHLEITTSNRSFKDELYMFIILNSRGAGGFKNLARKASIDDGLFDFIGVKTEQFYKIPSLLLNFFQGELSASSSIIYLQDNYFRIKPLTEPDKNHFSDVDGEKGPPLPLEIKLHPRAITVFSNLS